MYIVININITKDEARTIKRALNNLMDREIYGEIHYDDNFEPFFYDNDGNKITDASEIRDMINRGSLNAKIGSLDNIH